MPPSTTPASIANLDQPKRHKPRVVVQGTEGEPDIKRETPFAVQNGQKRARNSSPTATPHNLNNPTHRFRHKKDCESRARLSVSSSRLVFSAEPDLACRHRD